MLLLVRTACPLTSSLSGISDVVESDGFLRLRKVQCRLGFHGTEKNPDSHNFSGMDIYYYP
jgi:hypothetical protein